MARTRKHKVDVDGRECSKCDKYKPWVEYYAGQGANGKDTRCKDCMRGKQRDYNARPEVKVAEKERWPARWKAAHPEKEYAARTPRTPEKVRTANVLRLYGITPEDRQVLDERSVFGLELCDLHGGPETMTYQRYGGTEVRGLSIDHDHSCDRHGTQRACRYCIRGLVCCDCNRNVVRAAERYPEIAKRFTDYLERRPLL